MRLLHVPAAARRSGIDLLVAGFVGGIVLTMTALSVMRDDRGGRGELHRHLQPTTDDAARPHDHHLHHHHHRHHSDDAVGDVRVVDLAEQDRQKHAGMTSQRAPACCPLT